jgi:hypothetical protein
VFVTFQLAGGNVGIADVSTVHRVTQIARTVFTVQ